jgi:hypothetical protein
VDTLAENGSTAGWIQGSVIQGVWVSGFMNGHGSDREALAVCVGSLDPTRAFYQQTLSQHQPHTEISRNTRQFKVILRFMNGHGSDREALAVCVG